MTIQYTYTLCYTTVRICTVYESAWHIDLVPKLRALVALGLLSLTWPDVAPRGNGAGQSSGLPSMEHSSCSAWNNAHVSILQISSNESIYRREKMKNVTPWSNVECRISDDIWISAEKLDVPDSCQQHGDQTAVAGQSPKCRKELTLVSWLCIDDQPYQNRIRP